MDQEKRLAKPMSGFIKLRIQPQEKARLTEEADFAGITLSELFRRRVANRAIFAKTDLAVLRELRRIGGLLKFVHTSSGGAYSQQTRAALTELQSAIRSICDDYQKN